MRARVELAVALGIFTLLALGAAALGSRGRQSPDFDPRRSTFLSGPDGARGFAEALGRLGVRVERFRHRPAQLGSADTTTEATLVAFLGPTAALDRLEAVEVAGFARQHDLLLVGEGSAAAIRCYGYAVDTRSNPMLAVLPGQAPAASSLRVRAILASLRRRTARAPEPWDDQGSVGCRVPQIVGADTLLRTVGGRLVAVRLTLSDGRAVTLVADDLLFSNRELRSSDAGPFALRLVVGRYRRILVDEYHHGYGPSGSLPGALLSWSGRSPWGWAAWQLAAIGLLGLCASALRFGPIRPSPGRRRRSPLEHVRALATVLAAAKGHDLAVRLMVQGLRRRLSRAAHQSGGPGIRADPRSWLNDLGRQVRSSRARDAAVALADLASRPQPAESVLRAGNAVEDLWEDLKP